MSERAFKCLLIFRRELSIRFKGKPQGAQRLLVEDDDFMAMGLINDACKAGHGKAVVMGVPVIL